MQLKGQEFVGYNQKVLFLLTNSGGNGETQIFEGNTTRVNEMNEGKAKVWLIVQVERGFIQKSIIRKR